MDRYWQGQKGHDERHILKLGSAQIFGPLLKRKTISFKKKF